MLRPWSHSPFYASEPVARSKACPRPGAVERQVQHAAVTARGDDCVAIDRFGTGCITTTAIPRHEVAVVGFYRRADGSSDSGYAVAGEGGSSYEPAFVTARLPACPVPILAHLCNQCTPNDIEGVAVLQWLGWEGDWRTGPEENEAGIAVCAVLTLQNVPAGAEITVRYGSRY